MLIIRILSIARQRDFNKMQIKNKRRKRYNVGNKKISYLLFVMKKSCKTNFYTNI